MRLKTKRKNLRMSEDEFNHIKRLSEILDMKMEHYILKMALSGKIYYFSKQDFSNLMGLNEKLSKAIFELNATGRNINQIAKSLNRMHKSGEMLKNEDVLDQLQGQLEDNKKVVEQIQNYISSLPETMKAFDKILILNLAGYLSKDIENNIELSEDELLDDLNAAELNYDDKNLIENQEIEKQIENKNLISEDDDSSSFIIERSKELMEQGYNQFQAYLIAQEELNKK